MRLRCKLTKLVCGACRVLCSLLYTMCKYLKNLPESVIGKWITLFFTVLSGSSLVLIFTQIKQGNDTMWISSDPQVQVIWSLYRPPMDINIVDATTTVELTLTNASIGNIKDVKVFLDMFSVIQEVNSFDEPWICHSRPPVNPISTSSMIRSNKSTNINFPMPQVFGKGSYFRELSGFAHVSYILRLRINFEKDINKSKHMHDKYYIIYDNRTLFSLDDGIFPFLPLISSRNRSITPTEKIIDMIRNTNPSEFQYDSRCSLYLYFRSKGIEYGY